MRGFWKITALLLCAGMALAGCSSKQIYSEEEMTQIHDITAVVEEEQIAYFNVIRNSIPERVEQIFREDSSIVNFTSSRKLDKSKPMLALTFNAGPDTEVTEKLLDVLQENNAHATFFVDPDKLDKDTASMVKRMRRMGCEVGFYISDPGELADYSSADLKKTVNDRIKKIEQYSGMKCEIARPYGGYMQDMIYDAVKLPVILWSVDTMDAVYDDAASTRSNAQAYASDGGIVIMHDQYTSTVNAVRNMIPDLKKDGYQLLTVSELAYVKDVDLKAGEDYYTIEAEEEETEETGQDDEW